ncbi:hypothetical protein I6M33_11935 [Shewanella algae]|uniref:hypothetical protein n=1 Tax=Shewanella algae TaxID=38313 RepID=UPI001AAC8EA3|nr:hypothetical protein [Shewanella algae]MBO2561320.1 hypothetical protein [Shewanella algae]
MAKLTKEEVISTLQQALSEQQGKAVTIEQNGSWYKIDGGKSLRFAELEQMLADSAKPAKTEAKQEKPKAAKTEAKQEKPKAAKPAAKPAAKAKPKQVAPAKAGSQGGKTPKELWREKLAAGNHKLPRGF